MKMKSIVLFAAIAATAIILIFSPSIVPHGKNIFNKPVFEDNEYVIFHEQNRFIVHKKGNMDSFVEITTPDNSQIEKVIKLENKPALEPPLHGVPITEGIIVKATSKNHIIRTSPEIELLASFPAPGTYDDKIIVDKDINTLYLFKKGELYKNYPIATGKDPSFTPEGVFIIKNKLDDEDLDEKLGTGWLGLGVPYEKDNRAETDDRAPRGTKYGIHGTNEPHSIGKHASGGCIRMANDDIRELHSLVKLGTKVEIRQ